LASPDFPATQLSWRIAYRANSLIAWKLTARVRVLSRTFLTATNLGIRPLALLDQRHFNERSVLSSMLRWGQMKQASRLVLRTESHRAGSLRSDLPGAAVRFEGVVGYVSMTTNIVKLVIDISATLTGTAKRVTYFATAALRLSLFGDGPSL